MKIRWIITGMIGLLLATVPAYATEGFWHTNQGRLENDNQEPVKVMGVNWFGLETTAFAPHGLWSRNYKDMMDQIKSLGFNAIRLPYSNQALRSESRPNGIDYGKNPDLSNLTPIQIMDKLVDYAGQIGLKIILDRHRPDANAQSALWYTPAVSEATWIADWQSLARRYGNNSTVIGADLHNEPHDNACWGCNNPALDWKMAAEKAGNAILAVNSDWLIIVEGVEQNRNQWYWWGGNLSGVIDNPVKLSIPNRVVYSPHDYPASVNPQSWFTNPNYPANLPAVWDANWGNITKTGIAPVILGEFGTRLETESDKIWLTSLVNYLNQSQISWSFWSLNPNSGDTGGILQDDWMTVNQAKMDLLKPILTGMTQVSPTPLSTPEPTPKPNPNSTSITLSISYPQNLTDVIIDVEIFDSTNKRLQQTVLEHQSVSPTSRLVQVPIQFNNSGSYRVAIGIFNSNWSQLYRWDNEVKPVTAVQPTPMPTPSPTPTPLPTPMPTQTNLSVWWPTPNVAVNGNQPFKAVVNDLPLSGYKMYWQVDGGQLNPMVDSMNEAPHKEALVDVSSWQWRGNGPYNLNFIAQDQTGKQMGSTQTSIRISR